MCDQKSGFKKDATPVNYETCMNELEKLLEKYEIRRHQKEKFRSEMYNRFDSVMLKVNMGLVFLSISYLIQLIVQNLSFKTTYFQLALYSTGLSIVISIVNYLLSVYSSDLDIECIDLELVRDSKLAKTHEIALYRKAKNKLKHLTKAIKTINVASVVCTILSIVFLSIFVWKTLNTSLNQISKIPTTQVKEKSNVMNEKMKDTKPTKTTHLEKNSEFAEPAQKDNSVVSDLKERVRSLATTPISSVQDKPSESSPKNERTEKE